MALPLKYLQGTDTNQDYQLCYVYRNLTTSMQIHPVSSSWLYQNTINSNHDNNIIMFKLTMKSFELPEWESFQFYLQAHCLIYSFLHTSLIHQYCKPNEYSQVVSHKISAPISVHHRLYRNFPLLATSVMPASDAC